LRNSPNSPKNEKIAFGDDDDDDDYNGNRETHVRQKEIDEKKNVVVTADAGISENVGDDYDDTDGDDDDDDDDEDDDNDDNDDNDDDKDYAVEEVTGSAARKSIQRLRDEERKVAKDSTSKKKRRKKDDVAEDDFESENYEESQSDDGNEEEEENEEEETEFTDDFFKMVDSERADQFWKAKKERKHKKMLQQKMLGKHTTFVVESDYKMVSAPHMMKQNIEVVALGGDC
jgi:hypothetical protein